MYQIIHTDSLCLLTDKKPTDRHKKSIVVQSFAVFFLALLYFHNFPLFWWVFFILFYFIFIFFFDCFRVSFFSLFFTRFSAFFLLLLLLLLLLLIDQIILVVKKTNREFFGTIYTAKNWNLKEQKNFFLTLIFYKDY